MSELIDDWNRRHRWHPASVGAILADIYFQLVGDFVEISWNNQDTEEAVRFLNQPGGARVSWEGFCAVINGF